MAAPSALPLHLMCKHLQSSQAFRDPLLSIATITGANGAPDAPPGKRQMRGRDSATGSRKPESEKRAATEVAAPKALSVRIRENPWLGFSVFRRRGHRVRRGHHARRHARCVLGLGHDRRRGHRVRRDRHRDLRHHADVLRPGSPDHD